MSLIPKQTFCFNCGSASWVEGVFTGEDTWNLKHDFCTSCSHGKYTAFGVGIVDYHNADGEACNFMTNDPRFKLKTK